MSKHKFVIELEVDDFALEETPQLPNDLDEWTWQDLIDAYRDDILIGVEIAESGE